MTGVACLSGLNRWLTQCDIWIKPRRSFLIHQLHHTRSCPTPSHSSFTLSPRPAPLLLSVQLQCPTELGSADSAARSRWMSCACLDIIDYCPKTSIPAPPWGIDNESSPFSAFVGFHLKRSGGIIISELRLCLTLVPCLNRVWTEVEGNEKKDPLRSLASGEQ